MDAKWWWLIGMVGPLGAMGLVRALGGAYDDWKRSRQPELTFAPWDEVEPVEHILIEILPRLFGVEYTDCLITNDSDLTHFTSTEEESEQVRAALRSDYEVDVSNLPDERLVTLAKAIVAKRV